MELKEAIGKYLDACRVRGFTPSTLDGIKLRLNCLKNHLSKYRIDSVTEVRPGHLDTYRASLVAKGLAFGSRRSYVFAARSFFRWLHEGGKILTNPACDIIMANEDDEPLPAPPMSEEDVSEILNSMPCRSPVDLRNKLHIELLYSCGLRLTESLKLKVSDFDMANRSVRIHGKGGRIRTLPLMKGTLNALRDYLALRRSLLKGPDCGTLLIGKTAGKPLSELVIYTVLRAVAKRLRLKRKPNPHLFRHSIAVHLLQRGADIRHVQEFLGHANIDTTKIYLRLVPGRLKEDYDKAMPDIAVKA